MLSNCNCYCISWTYYVKEHAKFSQAKCTGQLEVSTNLVCHSTQIQNCGNSRLPHHFLCFKTASATAFREHIMSRNTPSTVKQNAQVSLKSVRILCVIQLRFRTVVIQGFLIKPCAFKLQLLLHFVNMCQRTCQVQSSKMHRSAWSQYESCVSFNSDSELW